MDDPWIFSLLVQNHLDASHVGLDIFIILLLVFINGFFSAAEMAIINLKDAKLRKETEEGNIIARKLLYFLDNQGKFLATIQVCITLAGFLSASFGADKFARRLAAYLDPNHTTLWLDNICLIVITVLISYLSLVFGELVPKRMAMNNPDKFARRFAHILRIADFLLRPMAELLNLTANSVLHLLKIPVEKPKEEVTEEEIRMLVDISSSSSNIHETEGEMIDNIFELNDTEASEIMTHRTNIVALPVTASFEELTEILSEEKYSRVPIYEEDIDDIIGVVSIKDVVQYMISNDRANFNIRAIMREPYRVPESKSVDALLKDMQRDHVSLAIVIDEYGGTAGLVTLEDVLEEIVGNIEDEYDDDESNIILQPDGSYIVNGMLSLEEVEEKINKINEQKDGTYRKGIAELAFSEDDKNDFDTIAGLVLQRLDRIPEPDELPYVEDDRFIFHVIEMEDNRIAKIQLGIKWYREQDLTKAWQKVEAENKLEDTDESEENANEEVQSKLYAQLYKYLLESTNASFVREFANPNYSEIRKEHE